MIKKNRDGDKKRLENGLKQVRKHIFKKHIRKTD